jgi:hypothetical protein
MLKRLNSHESQGAVTKRMIAKRESSPIADMKKADAKGRSASLAGTRVTAGRGGTAVTRVAASEGQGVTCDEADSESGDVLERGRVNASAERSLPVHPQRVFGAPVAVSSRCLPRSQRAHLGHRQPPRKGGAPSSSLRLYREEACSSTKPFLAQACACVEDARVTWPRLHSAALRARTRVPRFQFDDPQLASLKSAARAAIVMPAVFAVADKVIQDPQTALFAAFGSFAMLVLVDFTGPLQSRFVAYVALAFVGAGNIVVGALCSRNDWLATAAMAIVGFAILFSGVINGYFAGLGHRRYSRSSYP